jgi:hypothetical protein
MSKCIDCNTAPPAKGRKICNNCKNHRYEAKYPIKVAYYRLKGHAKARGKLFTITLEYFTAFCIKVEYIAKRGRSSTCYHVDRKDETLGYIEDNLQLLTNAENTRKYKRWKQLNERGESEFEVVTVKPLQLDQHDTPF